MLLFILWLAFAGVIGVAADARGRNWLVWFLLAILLSPLVAGLILALLPDLRVRAMLDDIRKADRATTEKLERADGRP